MIDDIRKQILKDTGVLVIPANTIANKPKPPFATINVTSPWIDDVGHADTRIIETEDGLIVQRMEAFQFVFSFNVYAETDMEAIRLARMIRGWFVLTGEVFMEDLNVVVVSRGNIENRTTFLVDSYEYKHGFDVQFRTTDVQQINKGETLIPDGSITNPDGSITFPDGSILNPDGSVTLPDGTITPPIHFEWIEKAIIEFKGVE